MDYPTVRIGDLCKRVVPFGRTLQQGETYTITKVNKVSARGTRTSDGVSVNQSLYSIVVLKRNHNISLWAKFKYYLISKLKD